MGITSSVADAYRRQVVPRFVDKACGSAAMKAGRDRAAAGLSGVVLELGFGSGLNLASYPPEVTLVQAVEPSEVGRRLSEKRVAEGRVPVAFAGLRGESIDLPDDSCDSALCTFTLCTIPGVEQALAELRRVLRPGGRFHFLEHGLAPEAGVQRWQHRLEPLQMALADGCHLTRDPALLVSDAGLRIESVESEYMKGPKPWVYMTFGQAVNPG
jgi:ubiquinone/menaquinone biosynthesis C-methylase UbiE